MKQFTQAVKNKKWSMKKLASRWGITPRQLSNIASDPKPIHWDALNGLPYFDDIQNGDTVFITEGPFFNKKGVVRKIDNDTYFVDIDLFTKTYCVPFGKTQISTTLEYLKKE